jgi:hypothetical protein
MINLKVDEVNLDDEKLIEIMTDCGDNEYSNNKDDGKDEI